MSIFARWLQPDEAHERLGALFLRALALIYLAAFLSLAVQITGLVGADGILPVRALLDDAFRDYGYWACLRVPTLFWLGTSDSWLVGACYLGAGLSLVALFGRWQRPAFATMFVLYLSLFHAGQTFLNFQWDYLLLEAGLLAVFTVGGPSRLVVFLYHWLFFRLRFLSGFSKWATGDPSWANLSAIRHYLDTQPLPHLGAWYAHLLPDWMLSTATAVVLFSELVVPFFVFLPRPFRLFAAALTLTIQLFILATSNHTFFNLLTIALCLWVLDDRAVERLLPKGWGRRDEGGPQLRRHGCVLVLVAALSLATSIPLTFDMLSGGALPRPVREVVLFARNYGLGSYYHVFPIMQTWRQELVVQGSYDGLHWRSYRFRYKPQGADDMPPFIVPHLPRLDWRLWFVPTRYPEMMDWFNAFLWRLREGSPAVTGLLKENPFVQRPPRFLRVLAYRYRFTSTQEHRRSGDWWVVEYQGVFPYVEARRP